MDSSGKHILSDTYLKVYHAASAYIDMDYRKPLAQRDAVREAVRADLARKQAAGISVALLTKDHRTYTDRVMKTVEGSFEAPVRTVMDRIFYWSMTVTVCLGIYILARLFFLDLGGETPYAIVVTLPRLATFLGLLVTLELVSVVIRRGPKGKVRILSGLLLVAWIAMMLPAIPYLERLSAGASLFRLNLAIAFVVSMATAKVSYRLPRETRIPQPDAPPEV